MKYLLCFCLFAVLLASSTCQSKGCSSKKNTVVAADTVPKPAKINQYAFAYAVPHDVQVKAYFNFMDTFVQRFDSLVAYDLDPYLIAQTNHWLIDSFVETDYDHRKSRGEFVFDQKQLVVLRKGDTLFIPNDTFAAQIRAKQTKTWLDINIPEFRMRIVEGSDTLFSFPVRVGQNRRRHLDVIDRIEDLRTKTGTGEIVRVNRYPSWIDPVTRKKYKDTGRDDGQRTKLPQIPWLEPSLDGLFWGQMIHPTTNIGTLGKTFSNGCIGTSEADAWRVFFYAPVGTKVVVRNDRQIVRRTGDTIWLPEVYPREKYKLRK